MTDTNFLVLFGCSSLFGGVVGGYFGTAEYRIRNRLPLITFDCFCPECGHKLALIHQLPIISWVLLKGKCHYCGAPISVRYPVFETVYLTFYCITFFLFWQMPMILCGVWFVFSSFFLTIRCWGYTAGIFKGISIFFFWHLIYGGVLSASVLSAGI